MKGRNTRGRMKQLKDYQFKSQKEALEAIKVELSSLLDKTSPEPLETANNTNLNDTGGIQNGKVK